MFLSPLLSSLKFIYSEKATKIFKIFTLLLSYVVPVKSKVKISQNFVAFSEYMNFNNAISYMENIFKFYNDLPTRPRKSNVEVVLIMISSLWFVLLSSVASDSTHKLRGWDWDAPLIYSQSRTSAASLSYSHTMVWKIFWCSILLLLWKSYFSNYLGK